MPGAALRLIGAALIAAALALAPSSARAADPDATSDANPNPTSNATDAVEREVLLRVIAQEAAVHTGPGADYREVYYAKRGELFPVRERATVGYWFRVDLEDGTSGWIYGDFVVPVRPDPGPPPGFFGRMWGAVRGAILGPPAIVGSDVEVSFSAGVLGQEGLYLLRPAWLVDRYFAVEAFAGLNARAQQDVFLAGLGWTLRMAPGATVGPYLNAGVGVAYFRPKVDNFTQDTETLMALSAGGGFEITFKKQITLRLDFRNWTLFDPDQSSNAQEYTSGLAIFF